MWTLPRALDVAKDRTLTPPTLCSKFPHKLAQRKFEKLVLGLSGAPQQCRAIAATRIRVLWLLQFLLTTHRKKVPVYRSYEILEVLQDGSSVKRAVVLGLEFAKVALEDLATRTANECIAADEETHQVVAQRNLPPAKRAIKRIFQIAYDEDRSEEHTSELQSQSNLVCRLLLEKKKNPKYYTSILDAFPICNVFFFNDTATTEIYTLSLHDALPI